MHTGESFGPAMCKCMDCAEKRYKRAEDAAMLADFDKVTDLMRKELELQSAITALKEQLKQVISQRRDIVMKAYHALIEDNK